MYIYIIIIYKYITIYIDTEHTEHKALSTEHTEHRAQRAQSSEGTPPAELAKPRSRTRFFTYTTHHGTRALNAPHTLTDSTYGHAAMHGHRVLSLVFCLFSHVRTRARANATEPGDSP